MIKTIKNLGERQINAISCKKGDKYDCIIDGEDSREKVSVDGLQLYNDIDSVAGRAKGRYIDFIVLSKADCRILDDGVEEHLVCFKTTREMEDDIKQMNKLDATFGDLIVFE